MRVALVGTPNCGKTALFNRLTGAHQKVANYAGVTVERKEGIFRSPQREYRILDLPGVYSLDSATPDEQVTRDVLMGQRAGDEVDAFVVVLDATNLEPGLRLAYELSPLGRPTVFALNMADVAGQRGTRIDLAALSAAVGAPAVHVVAIQAGGADALMAALDELQSTGEAGQRPSAAASTPLDRHRLVHELARRVTLDKGRQEKLDERIDAIVLHPTWGYVILAVTLFLVFQAVFSWSKWPMDLVKEAIDATASGVRGVMPEGPLRSLLVDGILVGVGSVLVFLPQILVLFLFILALEDSGYLPRAAFLLDRAMSRVGLSGRAFIPLLSSFACAVPGVMATRTIPGARERLAAIMVAPLMTCSARLPVYALIIGTFIPERSAGPFNLRGIVLFGLYVAGIVSAVAVAAVMKRLGAQGSRDPLLLELPRYHWPHLRNLAIGLLQRAKIFVSRVGTIILSLTILLWFLASYPSPPLGATRPPIEYSFAGHIGAALAYLLGPIGFNWQISIALVPGLAAREVVVSALATVYALSATSDDTAAALGPVLANAWTLPTALSMLAWYVFAPQCISTLVVVRRETNAWGPVIAMAAYMFALAYMAAFTTYRVALALGA